MNIIFFIFTVFLTFLFTWGIRVLMRKLHIVDIPKLDKRKIHKKNIPLGGGLAIFLAFFLVVFFLVSTHVIGKTVLPRQLIGLFLGGLVIMVGGVLDDKYGFSPIKQLIFPVIAALFVIAFGIGPDFITNPFGGEIRLDQIVFSLDGQHGFVLFADTLVFFWLMGVMFTTKLLDGLDGLVVGIVGIGALMIFFLSKQAEWYQPEVATLAIVFAGACVGFLLWNWHPAKIFLGEGGSIFTGYMLGSLAIISGGKIAITLLVLGLPMLDVARVMVRRWQKHRSIFVGDKEHLHFKLIDAGFGHKQTVLLFYTISLLFGMTALFLQSSQKLIALVFLFILMLVVGLWFARHDDKLT